MTGSIKVLFASGSENLIPEAIEHMQKLLPDLPLVVVSEFPVTGVHWIAYPVGRSLRENLSLFRWHFRDQHIRLCAVILQPRVPYRRMRLIAFLLTPRNFLAFNENFGHFMLRPGSLKTIIRHLLWRSRNLLVSEFSDGGPAHRFLKGLLDPSAFRRGCQALRANLAGLAVATLKTILPRRALQTSPVNTRPRGVSVIIPSRNGRELLAAMLPGTLRQIAETGEVIVIDNGSEDGTEEFLSHSYPAVSVESASKPQSFAGAVNLGIRLSRFSHVCLLNNDMLIEPGFFQALAAAFDQIPDLFCATAQIFFPAGVRREETGKAVMPLAGQRQAPDFPVRCELPFHREDLSYVLYGSGGCSLYDAAKLEALGGMDEIYDPAYVEDMDLGFRAWQHGWPSVFVSGAEVVHQHRATLSRYYSRDLLDRLLELHYLTFLARTISDPAIFWRKWREAVRRLHALSASSLPGQASAGALGEAWRAAIRFRRSASTGVREQHILAIGSGAAAVFQGRKRRPDRPLVLIVTPHLPYPLSHGGAVRMFNLMRRAAPDFDQVLVAFTAQPAEAPAALLELCCEVVLVKQQGTHRLSSTERPEAVEEYDSPAFHAALRQTVHKWKPAVAQLEYTQMAQCAGDCNPAKTILVEHDITLDLYRQLLAERDDWEVRHQLERWVPFETSAWRQVDAVVTMSDKDREMTLNAGVSPARAICLPNGVDLHRYRPQESAAEPRRLLFIGSFAHLPNLLALDFFLREAWPSLRSAGAILHIIAGERSQCYLDRYQDRVQLDLAQPGLELEDFVSDVRPAYSRATVVVAPLLASAGTNIKVMEAMAMGKAVVSTPSGISGLDLEAGKDVMVATTGVEIAQAILELFEDTGKRAAIERQARRTVECRFDWDEIARKQKLMYGGLGALPLELGESELATSQLARR